MLRHWSCSLSLNCLMANNVICQPTSEDIKQHNRTILKLDIMEEEERTRYVEYASPAKEPCTQKNTQTKWSTSRQAAHFVPSCLEHSTSSIQMIISDVGETKLAIPATTSEDLKSSHTVQDWWNLFNHSRKINLNPCHWHYNCVNALATTSSLPWFHAEHSTLSNHPCFHIWHG